MATGKPEVPAFQEHYRENVVDYSKLSIAEQKEKEMPFQFLELSAEERQAVDAVLRGKQRFDVLQQPRPRTVRIFVSATYTDMIEERTFMLTNVYPKLRTYCREKYGLDFQAIDLRWGLQHEKLYDDHLDHEFFQHQLRRCQARSAGPDFLAFLGQKSTATPLPFSIKREVFEELKEAIGSEDDSSIEAVALLSYWYRLDTNAIPNAYVLQSTKKTKAGPKTKLEIKQKLKAILTRATKHADLGLRYQLDTPASTQEWMDGFRRVVQDNQPNLRSICCIRIVDDIGKYLDRERVSKYIDLVPNMNCIDMQRSKNAWKMIIASERIGSKNVARHQISWSDPRGVDQKTHAQYFEDMCDGMHNCIRRCIQERADNAPPVVDDVLYNDVLQQCVIAKRHCETFVGRDDELKVIHDYVVGSSSQPLVVYGPRGIGKSALLAAAANQVRNWLAEVKCTVSTTVAIRFCGTTFSSRSLRRLLHSLCHQIAYAGNSYRSQVPNDFKAQKQYFAHLLQGGEFRGLVVILIDGVEHLYQNDAAHDLDWLPSQITKNVKVIISTSSDDGAPCEHVLNCLLDKIIHPRYHLRIGPLEQASAIAIATAELARANRTVTYDQGKILRSIIAQFQSPLFIKLVSLEACLWTSDMVINMDSVSACISAAMDKLFQRIEYNYGVLLVGHVLGYFTAAKDGISDCEMEDMLSLDDQVLNAVYDDWQPALRRIPPLAWLRIQRDIEMYTVERNVDETTVFFWCNVQVLEAASSRYLCDSVQRTYIHRAMADYYLGTWSRMRKKTYEHKWKKQNSSCAAVRYVMEQPLSYDELIGVEKLNSRKLHQLPYHLANAQRIPELKEQVLFNFQWIRAKTRAASLHDVIDDYVLVDDREAALVADALKMAQAAVSEDINILAIELSGCLLPYYAIHKNIRDLIDQCDSSAQRFCPLVPNWQTHTTAGGPLQCICSTDFGSNFGDVDTCLIENRVTGSVLLTTKRVSGREMSVWDVNHSEARSSLNLPRGTRVYPTPNGVYINVFAGKDRLQTFRVKSREMIGEITYVPGEVGNLAVSNKYIAFTYLQMPSPIVLDIEASLLLERFQYHSHALAISADERHLLCNSDHKLILHRFPLMEQKCVLSVQHLPEKIIATSSNVLFYALFRNKDIVSIRFNVIQKTGKLHRIVGDLGINSFRLSHSENMVLARALRRIYVLDVKSQPAKLLHYIQSMPDGVFVDPLSSFSEAVFSMDDKLVLAARHTYLGVWDSRTGESLRLLQWSVSPVIRLLTSDITNKAVTILADSSLQLWNFDNLDTGILFVNTVVRGGVRSMAVSDAGQLLICAGHQQAEARIVDLKTGTCEQVLEHSSVIDAQLDSVLISPRGRYAVTRMTDRHQETSPVVYDDKLWHVDSGEVLTNITRNYFTVFSQDDEKVVCFPCRHDDEFGVKSGLYDVLFLDMVNQCTSTLNVPHGQIVNEPFITATGNYLVFIQQCHGEDVRMCIHSFGKKWHGTKLLEVRDIWAGAYNKENFIAVQLFNQDQIIAIYQNHTTGESANERSAVIYDIDKGSLLKHIEQFLSPDTDVGSMSLSNHKSFIIDNDYRMFDIVTGNYVRRLPLDGVVSADSLRLILNGKYLAAISACRHHLLVFRTSDCYRKVRVFVHGKATHLRVCGDEKRTLLVGCADGRVISYTVVLDAADHIRDITCRLPSRCCQRSPLITQVSVLSDDVKNIAKTINEHRQMTANSVKLAAEQRAKPPSFKAVAQAAIFASSCQRMNSSFFTAHRQASAVSSNGVL